MILSGGLFASFPAEPRLNPSREPPSSTRAVPLDAELPELEVGVHPNDHKIELIANKIAHPLWQHAFIGSFPQFLGARQSNVAKTDRNKGESFWGVLLTGNTLYKAESFQLFQYICGSPESYCTMGKYIGIDIERREPKAF